MTVLDTLRSSIVHRKDQVILRSELNPLGGQSQLTEALGKLIEEGILMRLGKGVFAKSKKNHAGSQCLLVKPEAVLEEFFQKVGSDARLVKTERRQDHCAYIVDAGVSRISRRLQVGRDVVAYVSRGGDRDAILEMPKDLDQLPKKNVDRFVKAFAKAHGIEPRFSGLDAWAEAVTRAAGDCVQLDTTGRLLVSLSKAKLINGAQMARLMTNYLYEQREKNGVSAARNAKPLVSTETV